MGQLQKYPGTETENISILSTLIDFETLVLKTAYQLYQNQLFSLPTVEINYCAQQEVPHYHYQYTTTTTLDIVVDKLSIL